MKYLHRPIVWIEFLLLLPSTTSSLVLVVDETSFSTPYSKKKRKRALFVERGIRWYLQSAHGPGRAVMLAWRAF